MIKGHCFCKQVKFEITPPTKMCGHCHCESCRRSHGAAFVTWTSVPTEQFKIINGEEKVRNFKSSERATWMFCENCGSPLFQKSSHAPKDIYISAGCLSGELDQRPESHVSIEEKVPWLEVNDGLPCISGKD